MKLVLIGSDNFAMRFLLMIKQRIDAILIKVQTHEVRATFFSKNILQFKLNF